MGFFRYKKAFVPEKCTFETQSSITFNVLISFVSDPIPMDPLSTRYLVIFISIQFLSRFIEGVISSFFFIFVLAKRKLVAS